MVHYRDPNVITMSICGSGYTYLSTIPLTDNPDEITCPECKRIWNSYKD